MYSSDYVCGERCQRFYLAYKMGLALILYHGLQALIFLGVNDTSDKRAALQEGFWHIKIVVLFGITTGMLFAPIWILDYLWYPTFILGIVYLLVQALFLVDLAYNWAETMLERIRKGSGKYKSLLIGSTLILILSAIGIFSITIWHFDQTLERILVSINIILFVIMCVCSILPAVQDSNPGSGIFQATLLGFYSIFLIVSALINDPSRPKGSNFAAISSPVFGEIISVVSVIYSFLAIAKAALSTSSNLHRLNPDWDESQEDPEKATGHYNYSLFHVGFIMASCYTILYVTFWQYTMVKANTIEVIDSSLAFWSRTLSSYAVDGLYLWSLFAPILLVSRSF